MLEGTSNPFSPEIESCKYVYLRELSEPSDNSLRLVAEEARVASEKEPVQLPGINLSGMPIISDDKCRLFELVWTSYIAYSVVNESFAMVDETEKIESGRILRAYSQSKFLEYVKVATLASQDYPGPYNHLQLVCLNHVINVASTTIPEIRILRPSVTSTVLQ